MAARKRKYYKTRSAAKTVWQVLLGLLAVVIVSAVILFFSLKKYIVTDADGLHLEVPFLSDTEADGTKPPEQAILIEE